MNLSDKRKVLIINIIVPIIYYIVLVLVALIREYALFDDIMSFTVPFIIGYLVTIVLTVYDSKNKKLTEKNIKYLILYHLPVFVAFIYILIVVSTITIRY